MNAVLGVRSPFAAAHEIVARATGARFSAAVLRIDVGGRPRLVRAYGTTRAGARGRPVYADTRFDVASLTKVFVSTIALQAVARGRLELDAPLVDAVPEWRATAHAPITLRMLLAHTGGLRSGADYRTLLDRNVETFALREPLVGTPGAAVVYSDLGFIALGVALARVARSGLRAAVEPELARLGARDVTFAVPQSERPAIPATERDAWRGLVQGRVHDEKAWLLNGVAGHAGLFAGVDAVARLAEWYNAALHRRPTPLDAGLAREAVREAAAHPVLRRGLGWALKTTPTNSCGTRMSRASFGHTGFTGTVVWCDPDRDLSVVLLTNAVHYERGDLRDVRAAVCDAAVAAVDAA